MKIIEIWVGHVSLQEYLKQLQIKPRKNSEAPTGFEPMITVRCSTNWAMKPHWKQVKCEFHLYPLYEKNDMMCIW